MAHYFDLNQKTPYQKPVLTDEDAVSQGLSNIFMTTPGERLFRPEFGCDLSMYLGEEVSRLSALGMETTISSALVTGDSRIAVESNGVDVTPYPDELLYEVSIKYSIRGIKDPKQVYEGYLKTQ